MKNSVKAILFVALLSIVGLTSCSTSYKKLPTTDTVVISNELDGSLTVRVWGIGRNIADATNQARKNIVHEVIFQGVRNGNSTYTMTPLVSEANARTKYADYFDDFFSDRGDFDDFVYKIDARAFSKTVKIDRMQVAVCVTLRVDRPGLQRRLREDGIIKK